MKQLIANVSFYPIKPGEEDFLRGRHPIESMMYAALEREYEVLHVRVLAPKSTGWHEKGQVFFRGRPSFFSLPIRLVIRLRRLKPAVVIIHSFVYPIQTMLLSMLLPKTTSLVIMHHAERPFHHPVKRATQRLAFRSAHLFLFSATQLADEFVSAGILSSKDRVKEMMELSTAFEPVPKAEARSRLKVHHDHILLWVGRLIKRKDPLTVLRAVKRLKDQGLNFHLYMIYSSSDMEKEVRAFIAANNLAAHITLLGKRPHEELRFWFSAATCFVMASHYEATAVSLCEAMACDCTPVLSDTPSFRSMTGDGRCAHLFAPDDDESLGSILAEVLGNNAQPLKETPKAFFDRTMSYPALSERLLELIKGVRKIPD